MSDRPKVVITDYDFGNVDVERGILEAAGAEVIALQTKCEDDLIEAARDCSGIMNQYARVGAKTIAAMQRCKVIARYGVGYDIVDVDAASAKGILVTNIREYCTEEVANNAIALWMALARGLFAYDRAVHQGIWRWQTAAPLHRLSGQTVGIISFGKIGRAIAARAQAFGTQIIAFDPYLTADAPMPPGVRLVDKNTLLAHSDVLFMQAPMTAETRHLLSHADFAAMKRGVFIVNTGRGPTIDNLALYQALVSGQVAGAGLDDLEIEPAKHPNWSPSDYPLLGLPNVIMTPHAAYYSEESIIACRQIAASEVARVLTGQPAQNPVNAEALATRLKLLER